MAVRDIKRDVLVYYSKAVSKRWCEGWRTDGIIDID